MAASCRVLSSNIRLHTDAVSSSASRPLVVFFPWLRAKEGAVAKFVSLYHRIGLDVLVAQGNASHFLVPRSGMGFVAELHGCLDEANWLDGRDVFFHGASVGAYLLTLFQMRLAELGGVDSQLRGRLRGQVMDSIVYGSVDRMITGLVEGAVPRLLRTSTRAIIGAYLRAFHGSTLRFYARSLQFYHSGLALTPLLFVYCEDDPLCDSAQLLRHLLPALRARGHDVATVGWAESTHAAHYLRHPGEYADALEKFIAKCRSRPLARL